jgi:hypothetical protein
MPRKAPSKRRNGRKKPQMAPGIGEETMFVMVQAGVDQRGKARSRFRYGLIVSLLLLAAVGTVVGALTLVRVEDPVDSGPR